jgi:hypothetical protein
MPNDSQDLTKSPSMAALEEQLVKLKKILIVLLLQSEIKQVDEIVKFFGNSSQEPDSSAKTENNTTSKAVVGKELEKQTANKTEGGKEYLLLHRPTDNFEYEQCASGNEFSTSKETVWLTGSVNAELRQNYSNPVVSCWIPKDSVKEVENAMANTGIWGELGENPHKDRYRVIVKPGKYSIYSELRE